ncbi:MAG: hypothetical protein GOU97_00130 [Nanoarchaeota archaeon]|nr:hypothetical protein [Nanoarchaeota archaeon]
MKTLIQEFYNSGFLLDSSFNLEDMGHEINPFLDFVKKMEPKPFVINEEVYLKFKEFQKPVKILKTKESKTVREDLHSRVNVLKSYDWSNREIKLKHFVKHYLNRYDSLKKILLNRPSLSMPLSLSRITSQRSNDKVQAIVMVSEVRKVSSGNYFLEFEDPTGKIMGMITTKSLAYPLAESIIHDEVIGVEGTKKGRYLYVDNVFFPEIPSDRQAKRADEEVYAAFIGDLHVGSNNFLSKEFSNFLKWLKGNEGPANQKKVARKIKYLFVVGDLVEGVGIYPEQDKELLIDDVYRQYREVSKYLSQIPEEINLIMIPGNHDATRLIEPQPFPRKSFAKDLYELPNATLLSNPSRVNIHAKNDFCGFDVLLYHGTSFTWYLDNVNSLRKRGYEHPEAVLKFLLKKRHLGTPHGAVGRDMYEQDHLVMSTVPDVLASGHLHVSAITRYNSTIALSASCWQAQTSFQQKLGITPHPGKVPILNLQNNKMLMMEFCR